ASLLGAKARRPTTRPLAVRPSASRRLSSMARAARRQATGVAGEVRGPVDPGRKTSLECSVALHASQAVLGPDADESLATTVRCHAGNFRRLPRPRPWPTE